MPDQLESDSAQRFYQRQVVDSPLDVEFGEQACGVLAEDGIRFSLGGDSRNEAPRPASDCRGKVPGLAKQFECDVFKPLDQARHGSEPAPDSWIENGVEQSL